MSLSDKDFLPLTSLTGLNRLSLRGCRLHDQTIISLCADLSHLTDLDLSLCTRITDVVCSIHCTSEIFHIINTAIGCEWSVRAAATAEPTAADRPVWAELRGAERVAAGAALPAAAGPARLSCCAAFARGDPRAFARRRRQPAAHHAACIQTNIAVRCS